MFHLLLFEFDILVLHFPILTHNAGTGCMGRPRRICTCSVPAGWRRCAGPLLCPRPRTTRFELIASQSAKSRYSRLLGVRRQQSQTGRWYEYPYHSPPCRARQQEPTNNQHRPVDPDYCRAAFTLDFNEKKKKKQGKNRNSSSLSCCCCP